MSNTRNITHLDKTAVAELVFGAVSETACRLRPDVLAAFRQALDKETEPPARQALEMLIENAAIAQTEQLPLCQDTGSVWVRLSVGRRPLGSDPIMVPSDIFDQVDAAIRRAWAEQALRNSILSDALIDRSNTGDNTPAGCEVVFDPEQTGVSLTVMLKGGGSDNASVLAMLSPGEGWPAIEQLVLDTVQAKGANACPPLVIGVAVGSTFDQVAKLAKQALLRPLDESNPEPSLAAREAELLAKVNALGIGAAAHGGTTTALTVALLTAPCHMASLPVAVSLGCSAMRSVSYELTGEWL